MDRDQLIQDYERIKGQMPWTRANLFGLLLCTAGLTYAGWYITALVTLFGARFFFGVLCAYKDFLRWADEEMKKYQRIDDLRPKQ